MFRGFQNVFCACCYTIKTDRLPLFFLLQKKKLTKVNYVDNFSNALLSMEMHLELGIYIKLYIYICSTLTPTNSLSFTLD